MKEYKFQYMNQAMIDEIDELIKNGHHEALLAYGLECANAGVEGYMRGYTMGRALVIGAIGLGAVTAYAVSKTIRKQIQKIKDEERNKYVEVIDEEPKK